jgi:hypothetical protein
MEKRNKCKNEPHENTKQTKHKQNTNETQSSEDLLRGNPVMTHPGDHLCCPIQAITSVDPSRRSPLLFNSLKVAALAQGSQASTIRLIAILIKSVSFDGEWHTSKVQHGETAS